MNPDRKKKIDLLLLFLLFLPYISFGQTRDFGLWSTVQVNKMLMQNMEVKVNISNRLEDQLKKRDQSYLGIQMSCHLQNISTGIGYRLTNNQLPRKDFYYSHRFIWQLQYKPSWHQFHLYLRTRLQAHYYDMDDFETESYLTNYSRNRLKIKYDIKNTKVSPLASFEYFYNFHTRGIKDYERCQFIFGMNYKINPQNSIKLSYILYKKINVSDSNIVGLHYQLTI